MPQLPAYGQHGRAHGDQPLCQALLIEVVAAGIAESRDTNFVRREGTLFRAGAPPPLTQGSNASRLAGVALTANAMLAVLNDTRSAALIAGAALGVENVGGWGYLLTTSSAASTLVAAGDGANAGGAAEGFFPRAAGVVVEVAIPIDRFYRITTVSALVTPFQLISSILSLFGALGFFGFLYEKVGALWGAAAARMCPPKRTFKVLRAPPLPPPAHKRVEDAGRQWSVRNPFFAADAFEDAPAEAAPSGVHAPAPERRLFKVKNGEGVGTPLGGARAHG